MFKASELVSTAMEARGVAKFPIPAQERANQKKKEGQSFEIWLSEDANQFENKLTSLGKALTRALTK